MADVASLGIVNVTPGSPVGRLGADAAAAERAPAAPAAPAVVTPPASAPAAAAAADPVAPAASPVAAAPPAAEKPAAAAADAVKTAAIASAEAELAAATTDEAKAVAQAKVDALKAEPKPAAPETYEAFKLPEGVALDQALVDKAAPLFKELGLTQDQAQKLVDFQAANVQAQAQAWTALLDSRLATSKADPEIGGAKYDESLGHAKHFLSQFGTPALREYLNTSDAGNHVEVIRALAKAGRALRDDTFIPSSGGAQPGGEKSLAERLFPNHGKK